MSDPDDFDESDHRTNPQSELDRAALQEHGKRIAAVEAELERFRHVLRKHVGARIGKIEEELDKLKESVRELLEP